MGSRSLGDLAGVKKAPVQAELGSDELLEQPVLTQSDAPNLKPASKMSVSPLISELINELPTQPVWTASAPERRKSAETEPLKAAESDDKRLQPRLRGKTLLGIALGVGTLAVMIMGVKTTGLQANSARGAAQPANPPAVDPAAAFMAARDGVWL